MINYGLYYYFIRIIDLRLKHLMYSIMPVNMKVTIYYILFYNHPGIGLCCMLHSWESSAHCPNIQHQ